MNNTFIIQVLYVKSNVKPYNTFWNVFFPFEFNNRNSITIRRVTYDWKFHSASEASGHYFEEVFDVRLGSIRSNQG